MSPGSKFGMWGDKPIGHCKAYVYMAPLNLLGAICCRDANMMCMISDLCIRCSLSGTQAGAPVGFFPCLYSESLIKRQPMQAA